MKIKHYSASAINSFIERRPQLIGQKVLGHGFVNNASFARGKAVEHGIEESIVNGKNMEASVISAKENYASECSDLSQDEMNKFVDQIEPMVIAGINHFNQVGTMMKGNPIAQNKIKLKLDESDVPIIGYTDFEWSSWVRDLKTASKTPSALSDGYKLQGSIYRAATGKKVAFDYLVPLKSGVTVKSITLTDDDFDQGMKIAKATVKAMDVFFESVPEPEEMTDMHREVYEALAFPNIYGMWNPAEKAEAIRNL